MRRATTACPLYRGTWRTRGAFDAPSMAAAGTSRQARGGNRDELFPMPIRIKGIPDAAVFTRT
jgi:hypothetical protein